MVHGERTITEMYSMNKHLDESNQNNRERETGRKTDRQTDTANRAGERVRKIERTDKNPYNDNVFFIDLTFLSLNRSDLLSFLPVTVRGYFFLLLLQHHTVAATRTLHSGQQTRARVRLKCAHSDIPTTRQQTNENKKPLDSLHHQMCV